jgi:CRP/FNR family nitrogen fixation transcriptional regulator
MQICSMAAAAPHRPIPPALERPAEAEDINLIGIALKFARDQEIFGEGETADRVYKVVKGAVRCLRVLADGRRQIFQFYLPGDVFGVEAGLEHRATAEALTDSVIISARRITLATEEGDLPRRLWRLAIADLQCSQDHVLTLGRRAAGERVASLLVELAGRTGGDETVELPMSRQDMADYLGLTIETVSRTLTHLQASGVISMHGCRSIHLNRPEALAELCE